MNKIKSNKTVGIAVFVAISFIISLFGCKTTTPEPILKKNVLQICDTDIKSKCSGNCIDGTEPKYYFDLRRLGAAQDEADKRVAFLKKQGLGDLDDYPAILHGEKKSSAYAKYTPPECDGCKPKFQIQGENFSCEDFYKTIEDLNKNCEGCIEILSETFKK